MQKSELIIKIHYEADIFIGCRRNVHFFINHARYFSTWFLHADILKYMHNKRSVQLKPYRPLNS